MSAANEQDMKDILAQVPDWVNVCGNWEYMDK